MDTEAALLRLARKLEGVDVFAFDLETNSMRSYHGVTCLIQIATLDPPADYIVDVLKVWASVGKMLGPAFASTSILKVGHAVGGCDVPALFRDFGIVIVNLFDTYEAAQAVAAPALGLAGLLAAYGAPSPEHLKVTSLPLSSPALTFSSWLCAFMGPHARSLVSFLSWCGMCGMWGMWRVCGLRGSPGRT